MRISDWSSDVCSSDLMPMRVGALAFEQGVQCQAASFVEAIADAPILILIVGIGRDDARAFTIGFENERRQRRGIEFAQGADDAAVTAEQARQELIGTRLVATPALGSEQFEHTPGSELLVGEEEGSDGIDQRIPSARFAMKRTAPVEKARQTAPLIR